MHKSPGAAGRGETTMEEPGLPVKSRTALLSLSVCLTAGLLAGCGARSAGDAGGSERGSTTSWEAFTAEQESDETAAGNSAGEADDLSGGSSTDEAETSEESYVRTVTDAGEDDAAHPLDVAIAAGEEGNDYPEITMDLSALQEENADVIAAVNIPAVSIAYPVMWVEYENQFYLEHDAEGKKSEAGCIELDGWNDSDLTDVSSILYGHNMKDQTMFGSLKKLLQDETLAKEKPYVYIYSGDTVKAYRIFAWNVTTDTDPAYNLAELEYPSDEEELAASGAAVGDAAAYEELGELLGWDEEDNAAEAAEPSDQGSTEDPAAGEDTEEQTDEADSAADAGETNPLLGTSSAYDELRKPYSREEAQALCNSWYDSYVDQALEDSVYTPDEEPDFTKRPRLLMLATCYGEAHGHDRFLVHCVLEKEFSRE